MNSAQQGGNTLIVSLILMLVFTIIGMTSVSNVSFNKKMSTNQRDSDLAFQAAEAALAEGEDYVAGISASLVDSDFGVGCSSNLCFTSNCADGRCFNGSYGVGLLCSINAPATPVYKEETVWETGGAARESRINFPGLLRPPQYLVEFLCFVQADPTAPSPTPPPPYAAADWAYYYRVTSYAEGANGTSRVMLQSTFKVNRL